MRLEGLAQRLDDFFDATFEGVVGCDCVVLGLG